MTSSKPASSVPPGVGEAQPAGSVLRTESAAPPLRVQSHLAFGGVALTSVRRLNASERSVRVPRGRTSDGGQRSRQRSHRRSPARGQLGGLKGRSAPGGVAMATAATTLQSDTLV